MTRTPLSRSKGQRSRSPGHFSHRSIKASGSFSGECGKVLTVRTYCYVAVGSVAQGVLAPTEGGEGQGHIVAAPTQLVYSLKAAHPLNLITQSATETLAIQ